MYDEETAVTTLFVSSSLGGEEQAVKSGRMHLPQFLSR
jgi:hypothetical protein